jgi:hypothetical protein
MKSSTYLKQGSQLMQDFEKLGAFYLGKEYDMDAKSRSENLLLYDSKDLCTHAVVVGMTGSGKTGLCVSMLEEAAIDRIPSIVIDPKGDISNLLLSFPNLSPEEFRPWVDEGQADREGISPEVFATHESDKWKAGLESWGQDAARIRMMRDTVDMRVYTPGATIGRPLTILKSFNCPSPEVVADSDMFADMISSASSGLLSLLGIDADPIRSKEHILISNILNTTWSKGQNLDLGALISKIQKPPFERVGIMELDSFYPAKERNELAMTLNNLLASPSFSNWMMGEPINIQRMLHTPEGKPCVSIISIAHMTDKERMFFVTILLNEILSWTRTQAGTSSLRAILYMDEVYGYFPPTANPPSKRPMLTLLKQARAFGLGCVLATQNPVDLDYKGLSNAGTWFLGRLQTERDKARVIEGLEGASSQAGTTFDKAAMERTLAGLGNRVFLMNNVHEDHPVVFETRWAMSYLRGPLTRDQLQTITESDPNYDPAAVESANKIRPGAAAGAAQPVVAQVNQQELVPSGVDQFFVATNARVGDGQRLVYRPMLLGEGRLHYVRVSYKVDKWMERRFLASVSGGELPDEIWDDADPLVEALEMDRRPEEGAEFAELPVDLQKAKNYKTWQKELKEFLYRKQALTVYKCKELKMYSAPGEEVGDFKVRLEQAVSEERDEAKEKLTKKYASKFSTLQDRIRRAEDKVEVQEEQYQQSRMSGMLSVGTTLMGALFGRKMLSATNARSAGTSMRAFGRSGKEKADIERAQDNLDEVIRKYEDLEEEFKQEVEDLEDKLSVDNLDLEELNLPPRKSDISVEDFGVCWMPFVVDSSGIADPAY